MARIALVFLVSGLLVGASRCDDDRDDGGPVEEDEGSAGTSGASGGGGVSCGDEVCERGQVCCNASCGICTEPGGFCTQQLCTDEDPPGGEGNAPFCGGIAGIACPGAGECVDDPTDDCDPDNGGADCGGICECNAIARCRAGQVWNGSPSVCACERAQSGGEDEGVKCGPNTCEPGQVCCNESCGICTEPGGFCTQQFCGDAGGGEDEGVKCGPNTCAPGQVCCNESCGICTEPGGFCTEQFCGDPGGGEEEPRPGQPCDLQCDPGQHCEYVEVQCIRAPCPPQPECVDNVFCGGFAGFGCPGAGECVDDPGDDCDPENGGADCGGMCQCNVLGVCKDGSAWNESPSVCACEGTGGGEECGNVTCPADQVCCNASCGICAPPDFACIQIACL